jgi:hypothetical protein
MTGNQGRAELWNVNTSALFVLVPRRSQSALSELRHLLSSKLITPRETQMPLGSASSCSA